MSSVYVLGGIFKEHFLAYIIVYQLHFLSISALHPVIELWSMEKLHFFEVSGDLSSADNSSYLSNLLWVNSLFFCVSFSRCLVKLLNSWFVSWPYFYKVWDLLRNQLLNYPVTFSRNFFASAISTNITYDLASDHSNSNKIVIKP